ncbi:MAG: archaetidylserine synthase [archaeon]|nr:archaetidylserine synthase [archaeon]
MILKSVKIQSFVAISDIVSLLNMLSGFCSIIASINQDFKLGAIFLILTIVFDSIDGWVARYFNRNDELGFGKNIDSLCDVVSFAIAPAVLLYCLSKTVPSPEIITIIVCAIMASCGVLRLTRYNVIADHVDFKGFIGFPIPGIALILAAYTLSGAFNIYIAYILMIIVSYLMISDVKYPKFSNIPVIGIAVLLIILMISPIPTAIYGVDISAVLLLLLTFYYLFINLIKHYKSN